MSDFGRLRWRCRRGTQELDRMLYRYMDRCYRSAGAEERQTFAMLLDQQDNDLQAFFFGARRPQSPPLSSLVDKIRNLA